MLDLWQAARAVFPIPFAAWCLMGIYIVFIERRGEKWK